jgi:outer membrane biosynthesis protein TonB
LKQINTKKIIFLAFLLSLLFHAGSVVYIAIQKSSQNSTPLFPNEDDKITHKKNTQRDEWVETKAHASNFGTPVFFQDEPDFPQTEPENDSIEETDKSEQVTETESITPQQEQPIEKTIEIPEEKNIVIHHPESTSIKTESIIKPAQKKQVTQQKLPQQKPHSQPLKPISAPKPSSAPLSPRLQSAGKATADRPPLTLAQLTQGFLNHVKNEGNHAIHVLGKKNGTPSDEQIKYERYLQKLSWCLQNSFNIHNDRFPPSASMDDTVQVLLSLNKDGSMKHCHVSKTSGNRDLDYFTLFIFKDASTSFPPVPQYLPHDPFTINYVILVSTSEENRLKLYRQ